MEDDHVPIQMQDELQMERVRADSSSTPAELLESRSSPARLSTTNGNDRQEVPQHVVDSTRSKLGRVESITHARIFDTTELEDSLEEACSQVQQQAVNQVELPTTSKTVESSTTAAETDSQNAPPGVKQEVDSPTRETVELPAYVEHDNENELSSLCHERKERTGCVSPDSVIDVPMSETSERRELLVALVDTSANKERLSGRGDDDSFSGFENAQSSFDEEERRSTRKLRFADEAGLPLQQIRVLKHEVAATSRVVVLLLSPNDRTFEFLHAEYPRNESTTVQVLLEQLPGLATNPVFKQQSFCKLSRTKNNHQFKNDVALEDCVLDESELVLGILHGHSVPEIAAFAVPLLLNGKIVKAVNRAKRTGRGLKIVKSGELWKCQSPPQKIGAVEDAKTLNEETMDVAAKEKKELSKEEANVESADQVRDAKEEEKVKSTDQVSDMNEPANAKYISIEKPPGATATLDGSDIVEPKKLREEADNPSSEEDAKAVDASDKTKDYAAPGATTTLDGSNIVEPEKLQEEADIPSPEEVAEATDASDEKKDSAAPSENLDGIEAAVTQKLNKDDAPSETGGSADNLKEISQSKSKSEAEKGLTQGSSETQVYKIMIPEAQTYLDNIDLDLGRIQSVAQSVLVDFLDGDDGFEVDSTAGNDELGKSTEKETLLKLSKGNDAMEGPISDDDSAESDLDVPDLDVDNSEWKYPELRDYLGGDGGAEQTVLFMHAVSIAAVGLFCSMG